MRTIYHTGAIRETVRDLAQSPDAVYVHILHKDGTPPATHKGTLDHGPTDRWDIDCVLFTGPQTTDVIVFRLSEIAYVYLYGGNVIYTVVR